MDNNLFRTIAACMLLCLLPCAARAGGDEAVHSLFVVGGMGYTRNVSTFDYEPDGLNRNGFVGTVRLVWKPEHLLQVGLETGFQRVYGGEAENIPSEFGPISGSSTMNAVPFLLTFTMPVIAGVEATVGGGFSILYSTVEFLGSKTVANSYTPALLGAVSYLHPLSDDLSVGGEVRYMYFDRFVDHNLGFQAVVSYRLTSW